MAMDNGCWTSAVWTAVGIRASQALPAADPCSSRFFDLLSAQQACLKQDACAGIVKDGGLTTCGIGSRWQLYGKLEVRPSAGVPSAWIRMRGCTAARPGSMAATSPLPPLTPEQLDFARAPGCAIYGLTACSRFRPATHGLAHTYMQPHCRVRTFEDMVDFPRASGQGLQPTTAHGEFQLPIYGHNSTVRRCKTSLKMAQGRTIASYVPIWKSGTSVMRKHAMGWGFNDAYEGIPGRDLKRVQADEAAERGDPFIGFVGTNAIKEATPMSDRTHPPRVTLLLSASIPLMSFLLWIEHCMLVGDVRLLSCA